MIAEGSTPPEIWIAGAAAVTPLGAGREELFKAVSAGRSAIGPAGELAGPGIHATLAARIASLDAESVFDPMRLRRLDRFAQLALVCAKRTLDDAKLSPGTFDPDRFGVVLGTGLGGIASAEAFHAGVVERGPQHANPSVFPLTVPNSPAGQISIEFGLRGPNATFAQLATSAEAAIAYAGSLIESGRADLVLAGGVDDLSPPLFRAFDRMAILSRRGRYPEGARPFDKTRNGPVWGEGAGMVVLESREHAERRGVARLGRLLGDGQAGEPRTPIQYPQTPDAIARAHRIACERAGAKPDLVIAAANGACGLDGNEARALRECYGDRPWIYSTAGAIGHWTTAGAVKVVLLLEALRTGRTPPTLGLTDPEVPLRYSQPLSSKLDGGIGAVSAISPGGNVIALLFSR